MNQFVHQAGALTNAISNQRNEEQNDDEVDESPLHPYLTSDKVRGYTKNERQEQCGQQIGQILGNEIRAKRIPSIEILLVEYAHFHRERQYDGHHGKESHKNNCKKYKAKIENSQCPGSFQKAVGQGQC